MRKIALNIGSNTLVTKSSEDVCWINIDFDRSILDFVKHVDFMLLDVRKGLPFRNETVDLVYMSQFLDHLNLYECEKVLAECYRVMKPGGLIRIAVQDLDELLMKYKYDKLDELSYMQPDIYSKYKSKCIKFSLLLFGNLADREGYWGHQIQFTYSGLRELLENTGFTDVTRMPVREIHTDKSKPVSDSPIFEGDVVDVFPEISLIVEARKS